MFVVNIFPVEGFKLIISDEPLQNNFLGLMKLFTCLLALSI